MEGERRRDDDARTEQWRRATPVTLHCSIHRPEQAPSRNPLRIKRRFSRSWFKNSMEPNWNYSIGANNELITEVAHVIVAMRCLSSLSTLLDPHTTAPLPVLAPDPLDGTV